MIISSVNFTPGRPINIDRKQILYNNLVSSKISDDTVHFSSCKTQKPVETGSRKYWKSQIFKAKEALLGGNISLFNAIKKDFDINNKILNLKGFDLSHRRVIGANLSRVNFTKANLKWTALDKSSLEGANLYKANLLHTAVYEISFDDKTNFKETLFDPDKPVNGLSVEQLKKEGFDIVNRGSNAFQSLTKNIGYEQLKPLSGEWNFVVAYRPKDSAIFDIEKSFSKGEAYDVGTYHKSLLFSRDSQTALHPGLYIYPNKEIVNRIHKGKDIIQVLIPLGDNKASNVLKADYLFRTPSFLIVKAFPG